MDIANVDRDGAGVGECPEVAREEMVVCREELGGEGVGLDEGRGGGVDGDESRGRIRGCGREEGGESRKWARLGGR